MAAKITLTASGQTKLGSLDKIDSKLEVRHKGNGWTGSFVFKIVPRGSVAPQFPTGGLAVPGDLKGVHYKNVSTGADIAAGTAVTNATTDADWEIVADGYDVYVDYTHTSGSVDLFVNTIAG